MWIIEPVDSRERVGEIIAADPWFATPGVTVARVAAWEPILR